LHYKLTTLPESWGKAAMDSSFEQAPLGNLKQTITWEAQIIVVSDTLVSTKVKGAVHGPFGWSNHSLWQGSGYIPIPKLNV